MKGGTTSTLPHLLLVICVLLIVFLSGLDGINRYTIRRDELTTLGHIGALDKEPHGVSISHTIESLIEYSSDHAPLYYVIINVWGQAFEFNVFALRILSVWFGVVAVAGTYWLGKRLVGYYTGVFAAILLGTNVLFYGNIHEIRDWTMLIMVSVLVWIVYWHLTHQQQAPRWHAFLVLLVLTTVSLYTSYLIAFLWLTIGLYHLLAVEKDKRWWQISTTVIAGGLLFLPWIPAFIQGLGVAQFHMDNDNPMLLNNIVLMQITSVLWGNGLFPLFVISVALGLYASWKDWKKARSIVFFLVIMVGSLLILNEFFLFLKRVRYLLYLTVPFALFVGYGYARFMRYKRLKWIPFLLIGVWIVVGHQYTYTDEFNNHLAKDLVIVYPEYSTLLPILQEHTHKNDLLIQANYDFSIVRESKQDLASISAFYTRDLKIKFVNFPLYIQWSDSGINATPVEYATGLIPQYDEFWFYYHHDLVTDEIIEFQNFVGENYTICETLTFGERSILVRYVRTEKFGALCKKIVS